mmetsp:Transcript_67294/g.219174  ORF Transcript_67294/g.219174 Transcript_67294/m.219174 type:complete len:402 (-) Transcript_67294:287-1492(-)
MLLALPLQNRPLRGHHFLELSVVLQHKLRKRSRMCTCGKGVPDRPGALVADFVDTLPHCVEHGVRGVVGGHAGLGHLTDGCQPFVHARFQMPHRAGQLVAAPMLHLESADDALELTAEALDRGAVASGGRCGSSSFLPCKCGFGGGERRLSGGQRSLRGPRLCILGRCAQRRRLPLRHKGTLCSHAGEGADFLPGGGLQAQALQLGAEAAEVLGGEPPREVHGRHHEPRRAADERRGACRGLRARRSAESVRVGIAGRDLGLRAVVAAEVAGNVAGLSGTLLLGPGGHEGLRDVAHEEVRRSPHGAAPRKVVHSRLQGLWPLRGLRGLNRRGSAGRRRPRLCHQLDDARGALGHGDTKSGPARCAHHPHQVRSGRPRRTHLWRGGSRRRRTASMGTVEEHA